MIIVKPLETKPYIINNEKVDGFQVSCFLKSALVNVAVHSQDVDFTKAVIKVLLKRDGHNIVIYQGNMKQIGLATNIDNFSRRAFYQNVPHHLSLVVQDVAVCCQCLLVFDIDLLGTIDLRGTDEMYVEISLLDNVFSSDVDQNASYIEVKARKSTGFEKYVPLINSYIIPAGEMRKSFDLGNNVMTAIMLNYDKLLHRDAIINSVTFSSKEYTDTLSYRDLLCQKYSRKLDPFAIVGDVAPADEFDQCIPIIENSELSAVKLDITFNPENVTANNNVLLVWSFYTDVKTLVEHDAKIIQAQNLKISTLKQNGENAVV